MIRVHSIFMSFAFLFLARFLGAIDPHCDAPVIIEDAFENARYLCEQYYMDAPEIEMTEKNATSDSSESMLDSFINDDVYMPQ